MAAETRGRERSGATDDPLVFWTLLACKGLLYALAAPALVLIVPLRMMTRGAAWWLVCMLAAMAVVVTVLLGTSPAVLAARYVTGQLSAGVWLLSYARIEEQLPRVAPPGGVRIPTASWEGRTFPIVPTPAAMVPPADWWRLYLADVWRGSVALAALYLAFASVRDRLRRPASAVDAEAPDADAGAGILAKDGAWRPTPGARFRHGRSRRRAVSHPRGRALLGYLAASPVGRAVRLPLAALCRHLFLVGATGFGKTTLLLHVVDAALQEGWAVCFVDCKGDPDLLAYAGERGGEVYRLGGRRRWDALQGDRTQVADRLIAGEMAHSDARYYPEIMGRYVQTVLGVLDAAHGDGAPQARDPHEVGRLLAPKALKAEVSRLIATGQHDGLRPLLATIESDYVGDQHTEAALLGFRHRFNRLLESVIGPTLGPGVGPDGRPALDLERAVRAGRLVLFSVPTDAYQGQGKKVAMWAILAAQALTAELRADDHARTGGRLLFVVDEFAQLEEETTRMGPLLRMARSAGVGVILAAQGTADLFSRVDARLARATLSTILNACSTKIVMHQGDQEDREPWVEHFGEREVETRAASYDASGEVTGQRAVTKRRPVVSADELGKLGIGQAIVETDAGLLRVLVPARLPVAAPAEASAPDVAVTEPPAAGAPMAPDPDAGEVIDVEARTVEAPRDPGSAPALPGAPPGAQAGAQAHRAARPRRGSHLLE
jgi:hypothetical protein